MREACTAIVGAVASERGLTRTLKSAPVAVAFALRLESVGGEAGTAVLNCLSSPRATSVPLVATTR